MSDSGGGPDTRAYRVAQPDGCADGVTEPDTRPRRVAQLHIRASRVPGRRGRMAALCCLAAVVSTACSAGAATRDSGIRSSVTVQLESAAFVEGGAIPGTFTCDGENISPPLTWSRVPSGTAAFALTVMDPDAPSGPFVHWLLSDVPWSRTSLEPGTPPGGAVEGRNSFGQVRYSGPCPPPADRPHRYVFTVYALDSPLQLSHAFSEGDIDRELEGRVLAQGRLTGTYARGVRKPKSATESSTPPSAPGAVSSTSTSASS